MNKKILILILIIVPLLSMGQEKIEGVVLDSETKAPLPFVNILIYYKSSSTGTTTNVEGKFSTSLSRRPDSLVFSFVGYKSKTVTATKKSVIFLESEDFTFDEVVILPGVNPAMRIVENAVNERKENNTQKNTSHTFEKYNVFNVDADTTFFKMEETTDDTSVLESIDFFRKQQVFLMETYSKVKFKPTDNKKELVLATRTSGLKNPLFSTFAAQIQPQSAYENPIELFGTEYLNPISTGGKGGYVFELKDTLYDAPDTVFIIDFTPKPKSNFKGVRGRIYIHSENWAIKNVVFNMPSLFNSLIDVSVDGDTAKAKPSSIIIAYEKVNDRQWFPKEVRTIIPVGKIASESDLSMFNTSFYKNVNLDPPKDSLKMGGAPIEVLEKANARSDDYWNVLRNDTLTSRDLETYRVIDSISEAENIEGTIDRLLPLMTGHLRIKWFDLDLMSIVDFNNFEGFRLGAGGKTNENLISWFTVGGYFAYGFKDKEWKYGGSGTFHINKSRNFNLRTVYKNDVMPSGYPDFANPSGLLDQGSLYRSLYVNRMDYTELLGFELESYVYKSLFVRLFNHNKMVSKGYEYFFNDPNEISDGSYFGLFETGVAINWKIKDEYIQFGNNRLRLKETRYPVISANLIKGWDGIWKGEYDYLKTEVRVDQTFKLMRLGSIHLRGEWNKVMGDVPLPLLIYTPGIFDRWGVSAPNTFETIRPFEFLNDQTLSGHFRLQFNPLKKEGRKFAPIFGLRFSAGWGELSDGIRHELIDFKTMEKGFYEAGFLIDNLIKSQFAGFGVGYFHRLGPYRFGNEWDNIGIKLSTIFTLD